MVNSLPSHLCGQAWKGGFFDVLLVIVTRATGEKILGSAKEMYVLLSVVQWFSDRF